MAAPGFVLTVSTPTRRSSFTPGTVSTAPRPVLVSVRTPRPRPRPRPRVPLRMVSAPQRSDVDRPAGTDQMSVLLPEKLSEQGVALLAAEFSVVKKLDLTHEQLVEEIAHHDAIIVRSGTKMTRQVIEAAPKLKVIGRAGVGVDNIDIPAATERGILVVNAPTGNCVAAAEHTIALLTAMARLVAPADATIKAGGWNRTAYVGASLVEKTIGVVGLGRIGQEVAKRARGLGMRVIASDPFTSEEAAAAVGAKLTSFDNVLRESDFVTLHLPLIPSTKNLINKDAIAKMKPGARIINAARGGIVNEEDLLAALESGHIAGAALDCFEFEPPFKHPESSSARVVQHPNVLATPHLGASTREAQQDVAMEIATNVRDAMYGDMVPTMINAPAIPAETLETLKPRAVLCEVLGRVACGLAAERVTGDVKVEYNIAEAGDDTRILRAGVIKGLTEAALGMKVSIVNADAACESAGINLTEVREVRGEETWEVALSVRGVPVIKGQVSNGTPYVSVVGDFKVDMGLSGTIVAYVQEDGPGVLGKIGSVMGEHGVNISGMSVGKHSGTKKALVLLKVDSRPSDAVMQMVIDVVGDVELKPTVIECC